MLGPEQRATAEASKEKIDRSGKFPRPVVTQIEPAPKFWRAEEYHQRYLAKRGQSPESVHAYWMRTYLSYSGFHPVTK